MSEIQINHSQDLAKLEAEGFRLRIIQGTADHLLVEGIPAVTSEGNVVLGTLYSPLETNTDGRTINPCSSHQCWWIGEPPCDSTGRVMTEMISNPDPEAKGDDIETRVGFSRKNIDKSPYNNYYEKIWTYVRLIWHEAREIDENCDPRSEKPVPAVVETQNRVFHYPDMATTRSGIGVATSKLLVDKVAIVGLGGTGSYILDLLAKTPINEIHLFDGDTFENHNPFRSPGAPSKDELTNPLKVDWFGSIYEKMHKGIIRHPYYLTGENINELDSYNFVFVAVDKPTVRKVILENLISMKIPFIDTGMDVSFDTKDMLGGMCRYTVGTENYHEHIQEVISFDDGPDNGIYRNIQVADLNMLNAAMAVTKWKKYLGFYIDEMHEHHSTYTLSSHRLSKEDKS